MGCTALHLLMTNPEASIQHFDRVSQSHPEAFTSNFFLNMMPIHLACSNLKISEGIMLRLVTEKQRRLSPDQR